MKAAVQVLKQAEDLKEKVSGDLLNDNEAWTSHQKLQDLYQQLLVMDLEYALDKKVEQDLWNYVFKNQINALQNQAKDKKNPRRSESQGNLSWFLEAASGFYLQLLQEFCDAFDLDLPCRRKGSVYGIIKGSKNVNYNITPPQKSSCYYICQHCLVHLGDIARYRNQSLQAETFYRHAAQLVPSNGQPYNQLAILEAAKGEKLSMVFYYVRSIAVRHPFPVASTNLQKMFAKISSDDLNIEGKAKLSVYDYINTFLQFHGLIHMSSDLAKAEKLVKVLSCNLSTLIATESLSSWKLIQMIAINLFAVSHATHGLEAQSNGQNSVCLSEDEVKIYNLMLELLASVLNGILLLVYTMKDENSFKDYYALPVVKLILDWMQQDFEVLKSQPFANKFQIWPSLSKLLNGIQVGTMDNFDASKYEDVPLPEDWDLQCFLPLSKTHRQYKFKETTPRLTEEEEIKLRTHRLLTHGNWICQQELAGRRLMTVRLPAKEGTDQSLFFEAIIQQAPSSEVLLQLEEVSVSKGARNGHLQVESFGDSSSNSVGSQETTHPTHDVRSDISEFATVKEQEKNSQVIKEKGNKIDTKSGTESMEKRSEKTINSGDVKENNRPVVQVGRERKLRQNVAMQTIMQKKYIAPKNEINVTSTNFKPKLESKQVTFKTPSPSPPASSDGTPPQRSTPTQPSLNSHPRSENVMAGFPSLQSIYPQMQTNSYTSASQKPLSYGVGQVDNKIGSGSLGFAANRMAMSFSNQNNSLPEPISSTSSIYSSPRVYPSLPTSTPTYNPHKYNSQSQQASDYQPLANQYQLKEQMKQGTNNFVIPSPQQQPQPQPYLFAPSSQQKQNFSYSETTPTLYGQQIQWFHQPPPQLPTSTITQNQSLESYFNSNTEVSPQSTNLVPPPPQLQTLSPGNYHPIYPNPPPQTTPLSLGSSSRSHISENLVFQIQAPGFGSLVGNKGEQQLTGIGSSPGKFTTRMDNERPPNHGGGGEVIGNTYSLFNSPWSSGLNPSTSAAAEVAEPFAVSLATSNPVPSTAASNFSSFMQPGLQSLWSGPGPSPLERLLEQQKQKRDTAPQ